MAIRIRNHLHSLRGLFEKFLILTGTLLVLWVSLFCLMETFPSLIKPLNLNVIRYFAQRMHWKRDQTFAFIPRYSGSWKLKTIMHGDLYHRWLGIPRPSVGYIASWTTEGFRTNTSSPPFDVVVIGDSFVEMGETDTQTLSEYLKIKTGLATYNLGRRCYGPHQYLNLLRDYGVKQNPRYVLFCFFSGNDIGDIISYEQWKRGGYYHTFGPAHKKFIVRFQIATHDAWTALREMVQNVWRKAFNAKHPPEGLHPSLGIIHRANMEIPMRFLYWNQLLSPEMLLTQKGWKQLTLILEDFRATCVQYDIIPLMVYIPRKIEIYSPLLTNESGQTIRKMMSQQQTYNDNSRLAFHTICNRLNLDVVDLAPGFRNAACGNRLLYYALDTHWAPYARELAAQMIGENLLRREKDQRARRIGR